MFEEFGPLAVGDRWPWSACAVLCLEIAPPAAVAAPEKRAFAESIIGFEPCCLAEAEKAGS